MIRYSFNNLGYKWERVNRTASHAGAVEEYDYSFMERA